MPSRELITNERPSPGAREFAATLLARRGGFCPAAPPAPPPPAAAPPPPPSPTTEVRKLLRARVDLLGHPPVARTAFCSGPIRFLRGVFKVFMRPWLDFQTLFNQTLLDYLEALQAEVEALAAQHHQIHAVQGLHAQLAGRLDQMQQAVPGLHQQIASLREELATLQESLDGLQDRAVNREQGPDGKLARAGFWFRPAVAVGIQDGRPQLLGVTERILETIFVHTRLPRPPARVLALGCAESTTALEMASLGYQVTGVDRRGLPLRHPALTVLRADPGQLPLADASFDVAVCLATLGQVGQDGYGGAMADTTDHQVVDEVQRVLSPGGRFLLTVPFGQGGPQASGRVYDRAALAALLHAFGPLETLYGVRNGESWSLTTEADRAEQADSSDRVSAVALVAAERT